MTPFYEDDAVRLYNSDAVHGVYQVCVGQADLILTSPPYDDLRDYGGHGFDWQSMMTACADALTPGGVLVWIVGDAIVDGSETGTSYRHALYALDELGLRIHDTMIYEKAALGVVSPNRYFQVFEFMFVFSNGKPNTANLIKDHAHLTGERYRPTRPAPGRNKKGKRPERREKPLNTETNGRRGNIWRYSPGFNKSAPDFLGAHQHPAIMPLALAKDHIRTWTNPGDVVVDTMAGSGTTLRAAKDLNRQAIGFEIHEPYCELIARRLAQMVFPIEEPICPQSTMATI